MNWIFLKEKKHAQCCKYVLLDVVSLKQVCCITCTIQRDSITNSDPDYSLTINSEHEDTVTGQNVIGTLMNGALVKTSADHKYIELDGHNDYVDLGDNRANCLGNIVYCPDGLTLSMWLKPTKLQNGRQWYHTVTDLFGSLFTKDF